MDGSVTFNQFSKSVSGIFVHLSSCVFPPSCDSDSFKRGVRSPHGLNWLLLFRALLSLFEAAFWSAVFPFVLTAFVMFPSVYIKISAREV